jgi:hypothetical protein
LVSESTHPANGIVNGIVKVIGTMGHGHFFRERLANELNLLSEALAG